MSSGPERSCQPVWPSGITRPEAARAEGEMLVLVVDDHQRGELAQQARGRSRAPRAPADLADPIQVRRHEPLELLTGTNEEVRPLEGGVAGHLGQEGVPAWFHRRGLPKVGILGRVPSVAGGTSNDDVR